MELYENVKVKRLEWGEDLVYLSNAFCPFCGQKFELDDKVIEITGQPVFVVTGDPELDGVVITVHYECLLKAVSDDE